MPDKAGGVTLEPAITKTVGEIHAELGGRRMTPEEFDELFGCLARRGRAVATQGRWEPRFAVRISTSIWDEEVDRYEEGSKARLAAERERPRLERDGIAVSQLEPCAELGPEPRGSGSCALCSGGR